MITLPTTGPTTAEISAFEKKYGIKINSDAIPDGSRRSGDPGDQPTRAAARAGCRRRRRELRRSPRASQSLVAPYKVANWMADPGHRQGRQGQVVRRLRRNRLVRLRHADRQELPDELEGAERSGQGRRRAERRPGQAGAATGAVWAAALNNGGSLTNAQPGQFFSTLKSRGHPELDRLRLASRRRGAPARS